MTLLIHVLQLFEHEVSDLFGEVGGVFGGEVFGGDGREDFDSDGSGFESGFGVEETVVVFADDGDDGCACLDGEMEGTLLEREQIGGGKAGSCTLGENPETEFLLVHGGTHLLESLDAVLEVFAIDENRTGERHELTQERSELEFLFGHNRSMAGEDSAQVEDVHRGLMVAHQNRRSSLFEMLLTLDDELDAEEWRREPPEGASYDLVDVQSLTGDEEEEDGNKDAPNRTDSQSSNVDERVEIETQLLRSRRNERQQQQSTCC